MTNRSEMASDRRILERGMEYSLWTERQLNDTVQIYILTAFVLRGKRNACSTRTLRNG